MKSPRHLWQLGAISWALIDASIAAVSMYLGFRLTPATPIYFNPTHVGVFKATILYVPLLTLVAHALGLHNKLNLGTRWKTVALTTIGVSITIALATFVISFFFFQQIGRIILLICAALTFMLSLGVRLLFRQLVNGTPLRICVFGDEKLHGYLRDLIEENCSRVNICEHAMSEVDQVDEIVVPCTHRFSEAERMLLLEKIDCGIQVSTVAAFVERNFYCVPANFIEADWLFSIDLRHQHPFYNEVKRSWDIFIAAFGLIVTFPVLAVAIFAIRLSSRGPVFYSQTRVGLCQRPFRIWKLRSMCMDSEADGPQWAKTNDPRVTAVGHILRKTRIDELPQFWNILRGDMAFVGPRPERPEFVEKLSVEIPFYKQRHLVKPGLSGWAQICYPYGASTQDAYNKLSYDLYYIKNSTFALDLQILIQTAGAISRGAR